MLFHVAVTADGISIDRENPRYWSIDGQRTILIGGSDDDNLFQMDDLAEHLDLLVSVGGNYVRNTMSSRDAGNLWPFMQAYATSGDPLSALSGWERNLDRLRSWYRNSDAAYPLYDLTQANPEYWDLFENFLRMTAERRIIVQIEIWDRFDFAREPWSQNPFNPMNNINYSAGESRLDTEYPEHPGRNRSHFFRTVPDLLMNEILLPYQQAYVNKLLSISLKYDNVLYTISNETSGDAPWSAYWARYIRAKATEAGKTVYITEMWSSWDLSDPIHDRTFNAPELYDYVDVSQNNHQKGQQHWDKLHQQWQRLTPGPRPLNNVKIYGADGGRFSTSDEAVERFWRSLLGGSASARFHRPEQSFGLGLGTLAQSQLRSADMLFRRVDMTSLSPTLDLLTDREPNEAYLATNHNSQYVLFFPNGGSVTLEITSSADSLTGIWMDIDRSEWRPTATYSPEAGTIEIASPSLDRWLLLLEE